MTIKEILEKSVKILNAKKINSANLDAELLLLFTLSQSKNKPKLFNNDRAWLYAHNDYDLSKKEENIFLKLIKQREKFKPIAYITGKKEFYGLDFYVDKNVLIPRPETEILVENVLKEIFTLRPALSRRGKQAQGDNKKIVIADMGTGSGAIAISIAKTLKDQGNSSNVAIYATDISEKALAIAKKNAKTHNCYKNIVFRKGSLLKALPKNTKVDYLLANLPYLSSSSRKNINAYLKLKNISPSGFKSLSYEPSIALTDNDSGFSLISSLIISASPYLKASSQIFLESDPNQITAIKKLAKKYLPNHKIEIFKDLRGLNRITKIEIT